MQYLCRHWARCTSLGNHSPSGLAPRSGHRGLNRTKHHNKILSLSLSLSLPSLFSLPPSGRTRGSMAAASRGRSGDGGGRDEGVLVRAAGDNIAISPPLIVNDSQIDQIATTLAKVIQRVA